MNFIGYDEENTSLTDKDAWWKTYQDHVITEIRQLRGRMNALVKKVSYNVCKIHLLFKIFNYQPNINI